MFRTSKFILVCVLIATTLRGGNFGQMNFAYWKIPPVSGVTATYLVVAGGGGGGAAGGGGGAGGLLTGTSSLTLGTTYTVTVGTGGSGGNGSTQTNGSNGGDSIISGTGLTTITSTGGGGGGGPGSGSVPSGGSGGGASPNGPVQIGGSGTSGQGNAGGSNGGFSNTPYPGGGGGGAGAVGSNGSSGGGGNGGAGLSNLITGFAVTYAGGGGGSSYTASGGSGGTGGGGNGSGGGTGTAGTNGLGGGGGGSAYPNNGPTGGSGVVIISLPTGFAATTTGTVTVTTNGTNTVYTFTSSGTLTPYSGLAKYSNYTTNNGTYLISSSIAAVGSGNWTAEYWVYMISITGTGGNGVHFDTRYSSYSTNYSIYASTSGSGYLLNCILFGVVHITSSTTQSYNTWYHVALVKNGSTTTLYVNGTGVGTYSDTNTYTANPLTLFNSGIPGDGYQFGYNGYISNFRITTTAVYTANFTPPTTPLTAITGTIILTCNSSTISDQGPNSYSITNTGPITVSTFSPF